MRVIHIIVLCMVFVPVFGGVGNAVENAGALEIEADNSLEWDRENKTFMARGNAIAKSGSSQVNADLLRAEYHENEKGEIVIETITATGNATAKHDDDVISSKTMVAFMNDKNELTRIEARKSVKIKTPTETGTSDLAL